MSNTTPDLLSAFFEELEQTHARYSSLIHQAEEAQQPQLAKLFRAVVASEAARGRLFRAGMASHAMKAQACYVCPHCGLIFIPEAPEKCPVDETPGARFEKIN